MASSGVRLKREPTNQQLKFIDSDAREQLFGGAKRGGKSVAIGIKAFYLSYFFPGNRGLIFRRDLTDLKDTTLFEFFQTVPLEHLDTTFGNGTGHNKGDKEVRTKTIVPGVSSSILYRGLGDMTQQDLDKIKSLNVGWIAGDELSEVPEAQYNMLNAQLTWVLPDGRRPPYQAFHGSNPEPGWVEAKWIKQKPLPPGLAFIPSLPRDNPHLPPGWEEMLRQQYDPEWVRKYLDGSWEVIEGQYFDELSPLIHDFKEEWITPEFLSKLKLVLSHDHAETGWIVGTVNGFDQYDNQYVLSEWYMENQLISSACKGMCEMCEEFVTDDRLWRDRFGLCLTDPETLAKTLEQGNIKQAVITAYQNGGAGEAVNRAYGIPFVPAWNALELGLQHLKQRLHCVPIHHHPVLGVPNAPHLYICRSRCPNTWGDFRSCRKKVLVSGKVRFLGRDHGLDTVRYASNSQIHDTFDPNFLSSEQDMSGMDALNRKARSSHVLWLRNWDRQCRRESDSQDPGSGSWF